MSKDGHLSTLDAFYKLKQSPKWLGIFRFRDHTIQTFPRLLLNPHYFLLCENIADLMTYSGYDGAVFF